MKTVFLFLIAFGVSYVMVLKFLVSKPSALAGPARPEPIAFYKTSSPPPQTAYASGQATPKGTATPEPTVTATSTITPTSTPEPTLEGTPEQTPRIESTPRGTPDVWSPPDMEPIFSSFSGQFNVDKNVLERIANCESHFNPNATNGDYGGLFQFSSSTWKVFRQEMGENPDPQLRFDINESIKTGAYGVSTRGTAPWPRCV